MRKWHDAERCKAAERLAKAAAAASTVGISKRPGEGWQVFLIPGSCLVSTVCTCKYIVPGVFSILRLKPQTTSKGFVGAGANTTCARAFLL